MDEENKDFPKDEENSSPDLLDQLNQLNKNDENKEDTESDKKDGDTFFKSTLDQQSESIKNAKEDEKSDFKKLLKSNEGVFFERNKVMLIILFVFIIFIIFFAVVYPELKTRKKKTDTSLEKRGNVYIPPLLEDKDENVVFEDGNSITDEDDVPEKREVPFEEKFPPIVEEQSAPVKVNNSNQVEVPVTNRNEQQKQLQRLTLNQETSVSSSTTNTSSTRNYSNYRNASGAGSNSTAYMPAALSASISRVANQGNTYEQQNNQSNKQQFAEKNAGQTSFQWNSDYSLWKGTVITGVLDTGVNTDLPGQIMAHVTKNVYSSKDGTYLLIPQGSRLYGEYNSLVSYGQVRIQVVWNTLIRPDGLELSLGTMTGIDKYGYSGYKGYKTEHPFEFAKAMGLIAMFSIFDTKMANTIDTQNNQYAQNALSSAYSEAKQMSNKILERAMDIQPTIKIKAGTEINLITNLTIDLPPVEDHEVTQKYVRY